MDDELLDPHNPLSMWAYMWFSDEEVRLKKRKRKKQKLIKLNGEICQRQ
jgi:hypothetical protein